MVGVAVVGEHLRHFFRSVVLDAGHRQTGARALAVPTRGEQGHYDLDPPVVERLDIFFIIGVERRLAGVRMNLNRHLIRIPYQSGGEDYDIVEKRFAGALELEGEMEERVSRACFLAAEDVVRPVLGNRGYTLPVLHEDDVRLSRKSDGTVVSRHGYGNRIDDVPAAVVIVLGGEYGIVDRDCYVSVGGNLFAGKDHRRVSE